MAKLSPYEIDGKAFHNPSMWAAQSIRGQMASMGLRIHRDAPWRTDLIAELLRFPVGVHDDQADALGLVGQLLDKMLAPANDKPAEMKSRRDMWSEPDLSGSVDWRTV